MLSSHRHLLVRAQGIHLNHLYGECLESIAAGYVIWMHYQKRRVNYMAYLRALEQAR
jgi:hypothetical protein